MNRAERRRLAKQGAKKEPVYNLKSGDIQKIKNDTTTKAVDIAFSMLLAIPIKVMHDKYGWRMRKRLPELSDALIDEYQRFCDGEQTLQEYQDMVFEQCGVKFMKNNEE